jgi:hypothetical protein
MGIFSLFGKQGFIKSNLKVYFEFRKLGAIHEDALMTCLKTRYPFEPGKSQDVKICWEGAMMADQYLNKTKRLTDKQQLMELVRAMYTVETYLDKVDSFKRVDELDKLEEEFNKQYDLMQQKYLC